ncbi:unnamed protein product [Dracunculus medinensis]|uniref:mRNA_decap_C domain-containing protein n=1 Tax=Dracunculus medinensis TaxID=318479 RepID=A0A0N4UIU5_DRAME|nr:unnamed protein product [Dracunculus medinensis]
MANFSVDAVNLATVKSADPQVSSIINLANFAQLYHYNFIEEAWKREKFAGPIFLCKRSEEPKFCLIVKNQCSPNDYIEFIQPEMRVCHSSSSKYSCILAFWIYDERDRIKIYKQLLLIIQSCDLKNTKISYETNVLQDNDGNDKPSWMKQLFIISDKSTLVTDKLEKRLKNDLIENNKKASQNMELIKQSITYNSEESLNGIFNSNLNKFYCRSIFFRSVTPRSNAFNINHLMGPSCSKSTDFANLADTDLIERCDEKKRNAALNKEQFILALCHLIKNDDGFASRIYEEYIKISSEDSTTKETIRKTKYIGSPENINLTSLKQIDPDVKAIIDKAKMITGYKFDKATEKWKRMNLKGPLFLCERSCLPNYCFIVRNLESVSDLIQPVVPKLSLCLKSTGISIRRPVLNKLSSSSEIVKGFFNASELETLFLKNSDSENKKNENTIFERLKAVPISRHNAGDSKHFSESYVTKKISTLADAIFSNQLDPILKAVGSRKTVSRQYLCND